MSTADLRRSALSFARALGGTRPMLPIAARLLCARTVEESPTFLIRDAYRPAGVHRYRLRENGLEVPIRHAANDGATLAEVFYRHDYRPPNEVIGPLGEPASILDLGANIGLFGLYAAPLWPRAEIVAYEADPANVSVHEIAIAANGLTGRWHVVPAAAGAHEGDVTLASGRAMGSFVTAPGVDPGVPTIEVPMLDVMSEIAASDLVKVDIEGGEWEILGDPRFRRSPPRVLVLEYHPHLCPSDDPRAAAESALAEARMSTASIWHRDDGYGMFWAWRR